MSPRTLTLPIETTPTRKITVRDATMRRSAAPKGSDGADGGNDY